MIQSSMEYFDIVFPLNLRPLTYRCPPEFAGIARPGMIVSAPIKNRLTKGIILNRNASPPPGRIKDFSIIEPGAPEISKGLLKIIKWMSDYYISSEGLVVKHTLPNELFVKTRTRRSPERSSAAYTVPLIDIPEETIPAFAEMIVEDHYQAYLCHAPSLIYEYSMAAKLISSAKNVIVLLPEVSQADLFYESVEGVFGERICLLHSQIAKGRRSESIAGILSGRHDIVVGIRSALFAPLKRVSLIVVLQEHSNSYKLDEGLRFNIRDVAVMRGYIEKATVMLSSVTPSVDSYFNTMTGKYRLIRTEASLKQKIRVIDMRFAKTVKPGISKDFFEVAKSRIRAGKRVMFIINRRGYSTLLHCKECGQTENCRICQIPLVFHKGQGRLTCHYCGQASSVPDLCSRCRSHEIELLGVGTEKIQEYVEELFGFEPVRFDSDSANKRSEIRDLLNVIYGDETQVIVGTKMMTGRMGISERFSTALLFNVDSLLNLPDYRAAEKAYMEIGAISGLLEADGEVMIQTRFPQHSLFKYLRKNDYQSFVEEELRLRKELNYPPYSKLLRITFSADRHHSDSIIGYIQGLRLDLEILGPTEGRDKKGTSAYTILLKSTGRKTLNNAARALLSKFGESKDMKIRIDIDPT